MFWPVVLLADRVWFVITRIQSLFQEEFELGTGLLWVPIGFAFGATLYFSLTTEPELAWLLYLSGFLLILTIYSRFKGYSARALVFITAISCGLAAANVEALLVATIKLDRERTVKVTGWITKIENTARNRMRLFVRVRDMKPRWYPIKIAASNKKMNITVTTSRFVGKELRVGNGVSFLAKLRPPSAPLYPRGYDFSRRAWFQGRGASGFILGKPRLTDIGFPPITTRLMTPVARLRSAISNRIFEVLPSVSGAVAAALTVGEYRSIPETVNSAMRSSGIYHIISISGLHMSMVAGIVFSVLRFLLSLHRPFVERYNTKKISAVCAFILSTFYLLISGCAVATVRSWVMLNIALLAVLTDRSAITLHTVALSCGLILLASPSVVVEPSFLMSFMSVFGLVAAFKLWRSYNESHASPVIVRRSLAFIWLRWFCHCVLGVVLASLIAGICTAPVVIDEFHRMSAYSMLTNVLVFPVVGLIVMPMAVLSMLLMCFGLERFPLQFMGYGIDVMLETAAWIASLPGSDILVGSIHPLTKPLSLLGLLWIILWQTRLRLLGLLLIVVSCCLAPFAHAYDILVSSDGRTVSVLDVDGKQRVVGASRNRFAVKSWLLANGDARKYNSQGLDAGWLCNHRSCEYDLSKSSLSRVCGSGGEKFRYRRLLLLLSEPDFERMCQDGNIIVTMVEAPFTCKKKALIIDVNLLKSTSGLAIRYAGGCVGMLFQPMSGGAVRLWSD